MTNKIKERTRTGEIDKRRTWEGREVERKEGTVYVFVIIKTIKFNKEKKSEKRRVTWIRIKG